MLWIVDGGMINLPVVARVEDFKEDSYIEITGADENHEWKSEPTRYEAVTQKTGKGKTMVDNKAVWVPCNPLQTRSSKFMCSWCGGIAYYPQNHHIKERSGCLYRYCPRCGKVMTIIEKGEE